MLWIKNRCSRPCLLRVEVVECPLQKTARDTRDQAAAAVIEPGGRRRCERGRAANEGTEVGRARQVVVDPLAGDEPPSCGQVALVGRHEIDVTAARQVGKRQPPTSQRFVEEPEPPPVDAVGGGSHESGDRGGIEGREDRGQEGEARAVILERKLELLTLGIARPIAGTVDIDDGAGRLSDGLADRRCRHHRLMPVRDHPQSVPAHDGRISSRTRCGLCRCRYHAASAAKVSKTVTEPKIHLPQLMVPKKSLPNPKFAADDHEHCVSIP